MIRNSNSDQVKTIWYVNWEGEWKRYSLPATKENLEWVKKNIALNGKAEIFVK
jgi:hypothetical protein